MIPSSVKSIKNGAFSYCDGLISINVDKNNKNYTSINGVLLNKNKDTILRCPSGKVGKIVIPSGVTRIENDAFFLCWSLTSISIPSTVRSIGDGAFCACSALMSINIPSGVTSIGKNAFSACSSLSSISIPSSVKSIGNRVFSDCDQLISVRMSSGVVSIGSGAFYNCSSLKSISIPSSVEIIGSKAFLGCRSLTSISIPSSVVSIGERAFINCRKLTSINIDENNKNYASVDGVLFNKNKDTIIQCPAGKDGKYIIPSSVVNIGERAFRGSSLTSISIPSSVKSIGGYAFFDCRSLTSISIPSSVTSIEEYAFLGCRSLTIKGYSNSYAEKYAEKNNIKFQALKVENLINQSKVSSQTITLGSSITIRGIASGGVGPYKYRYASKNEKDSKWTLLKGYTTENTLKFTPKEVGIYSISIRVMDSTGKIAYKTIQLKVNPKPLINKSEVSSQTITLGSSITIRGIASGGVGPYKYRYTSKNEKDSKWTLLKGYTTENTLKFTPKEVGIYSISIRVMDSTGKIAYKIIQLTVKSK